MRAIRLPFPLTQTASGLAPMSMHISAQWELMRHAGMLIDFPDRKISYALFCFDKSEVPEYSAELRKAVDLQSPGHEPAHMEIRINH
jgi:hypothetical protein